MSIYDKVWTVWLFFTLKCSDSTPFVHLVVLTSRWRPPSRLTKLWNLSNLYWVILTYVYLEYWGVKMRVDIWDPFEGVFTWTYNLLYPSEISPGLLGTEVHKYRNTVGEGKSHSTRIPEWRLLIFYRFYYPTAKTPMSFLDWRQKEKKRHPRKRDPPHSTVQRW